jgi:hypothetical protein
LIALSHIAISMLLYVSWSGVGAPIIDSVQGRYYLPLATLWAVFLQWPRSLQERLGPRLRLTGGLGCLAWAVVFLGHALHIMIRRYWS